MKVLKHLIAPLLVCSSLVASENSLEEYLSSNKQEQFKYDYIKVQEESTKLRDSWIAPFSVQYSYSRSNANDDIFKNAGATPQESVSHSAFIKMDQPIFRSGGIYFGIKYARALERYSAYSLDVAKTKLIKETISILMQIKQAELRIKKQELQIENADIALEQKREQYLSGQLDSSFLDSAIIERNAIIQALYDLESSKEKLVASFKSLSDMDYERVKVPTFELISKEEFLKQNIVLKMQEAQADQEYWNKNVTLAKYLPSVNLTAGYNWSKTEGQMFAQTNIERDYYDYGFRASLPLDINSLNDYEASRVSRLKADLVVEDKKREVSALYEQVIQNIKNYEKKRELAKQNQEIYSKLVDETKTLFDAGYKTHHDVKLLQNSHAVALLDEQIFELERQNEILSLYEMIANAVQ